ncbi:mRNA splicing protein PRP28 [Kluyveromyces lactis]|uniref:Pre-mRNA-splicing ATP-dependent RNA helicase PRP28 n=1 Tax=Kluyveromyces lactis (strain ATCC 8585 / CBS 2359 / DSM 70799 / NBRC 1267 / NRRL Y-1140 / WM37) TaxID=284590 RepID=PRP28_KLULA|nr:uncharacterized protein KLLA0_C15433g [Kluyveromyces lactis]Q6CT49.1 RecName: Full=Pre-mRNA-splicing ATP-dependent RNA helicase PRP28 [Kluyveromyces lactis NRRL Y-1140]CAH01741.1 KLLA0C15433p [Kluyveromyces lactis]|eukprot:XP_452890.1 uncharacterized protein KLLA0_C15433g [Kluyveromyces lactis]
MLRPVSIDDLISDTVPAKKPRFLIKKRTFPQPEEEEASKALSHTVIKRKDNYRNLDEDELYEEQVSNEPDDLLFLARKSADLLKKRQNEDESIVDNYLGKHWSEKKYEEMSTRDWRILSEDFNISSKGGTVEKPLRNWHELKLIPEDLLNIITNDLHYNEPTSIQRSTIPNVINNRDFIGVASTGSGKTLAFLLPILIKLHGIPPLNSITKHDGPLALVLAPTRELAQQIQHEGQSITKLWKRPCNIVSIVGGHSLEEISANLRDGCDILVATPGRLLDCLDSHLLFLKQVNTLVLDEADKMIDFGFEDQLTTILAKTETISNRQTMMFTATFSPTIEKVANGYLKKPSYVTVGGEESKPKIKQIVRYVPDEEEKLKILVKDFLPNYKAPIIIFINYKRTADWLFDKLREARFRATTLHGSKSQEQREHSLSLLRNGKVDILIATDVAGRGIDIPNVSLVVNLQFPKSFDSFVHRVGRTGRAGKTGTALTFLTEEEDHSAMAKLFDYVKKNDFTGENYISKEAMSKYNVDKSSYKPIII